MTGLKRALGWLLGSAAPVASPAPVQEQHPLWPPLPGRPNARISDAALAEATTSYGEPLNPWQMPELPPFARKATAAQLAMDGGGAYGPGNTYQWASMGQFSEGLGFLGYAYLGELTQRPEYRRVSEIFAAETTRKWIKLSGDPDRVANIEKALTKHDVRAHVRRVVELDGFFGRGQIYIDMGDEAGDVELHSPLVPAAKVSKGSIKAFRVIEPFWSYPGTYDTRDPLNADFYKPRFWYVMSGQVDASRMITIVGREMPDMLKPAYSFGGLSLSQMIKPYVDNWLRTRQSVSDMLHSFSTMVLSTDISTVLSAGPATGLLARIKLFNATRDNRGLMVLNKDTEELTNVSAPLGTLDKLQSQSQEQIASACGIPLVVLLGVTPSGLNASSDGEMRSFYDNVKSYQERTLRTPLHRILDLVQLDLDGKIDPEITFEFEDLWEMSELDRANVRKTNAEIDSIYVGVGVVDNDEVRTRITQDEESPYFGAKLVGNDDLNAPPPSPAEIAAAKGEDNPDANAPPGTPKKGVTATAPSSKQAADVWTFDPVDLVGLAMDGQHWITVHPNGDDETGHPVLISGTPESGYKIIGGAGGKLNGTSVSPGSMSAARADHHDASHAAHEASKHAHKEGTAAAHELAAEAHGHAKTAKDKAGLTKEGGEHGRKLAEHKQLAREAAPSPDDGKAKGDELSIKANEASKHAKSTQTVKGHDEAAEAHAAASEHQLKLGNKARGGAHNTAAKAHERMADNLRGGPKEADKPAPTGPSEADLKQAEKSTGEATEATMAAALNGNAATHKAASDAHAQAAVDNMMARKDDMADEHGKAAVHHANKQREHENNTAEAMRATHNAYAISEMADKEGTESAHRQAARAHVNASLLHGDNANYDQASKHSVAAVRHTGIADTLKQQSATVAPPPLAVGSSLAEHTDRAEALSTLAEKEKTTSAHTAAANAHLEAQKEHYKAGSYTKAREHYAKYGKHFDKSLALRKKARNVERQTTHVTPEIKARVTATEKRYLGKPHAEIERDLESRFGLQLLGDHERHEKAYDTAYKAHNISRTDGTYRSPEHEREASDNVSKLRETARMAQTGRVRSVTPHDLSSTTVTGKKNAVEARKTLGHIHAAMEHLESQGFNIKAVLAKHPVAVVPASAGSSAGVSWQNKGRGHLVLSSNKVNDAFLADVGNNIQRRKDAGANRWGVSDSASIDQYHTFTAIHELAHAIGMQDSNGSVGKLQNIMRRMHPDQDARRKWFAENVSDYGAKNSYEMDAELAAMVAGPGYVRGTLPKELEDHVDTLFGRNAS